MNNYNEVKKSFGTQAEKFASYHMSKAEYTDYLIRSIQAKGNEHALEVAAGTCICGRAVAPYVKDITCLDLRYRIPDRIEEVSNSLIQSNGYDYIDTEDGDPGPLMGIWLETENAHRNWHIVRDLFQREKFIGNDLSLSAQIYISEKDTDDLENCVLVFPE